MCVPRLKKLNEEKLLMNVCAHHASYLYFGFLSLFGTNFYFPRFDGMGIRKFWNISWAHPFVVETPN